MFKIFLKTGDVAGILKSRISGLTDPNLLYNVADKSRQIMANRIKKNFQSQSDGTTKWDARKQKSNPGESFKTYKEAKLLHLYEEIDDQELDKSRAILFGSGKASPGWKKGQDRASWTPEQLYKYMTAYSSAKIIPNADNPKKYYTPVRLGAFNETGWELIWYSMPRSATSGISYGLIHQYGYSSGGKTWPRRRFVSYDEKDVEQIKKRLIQIWDAKMRSANR